GTLISDGTTTYPVVVGTVVAGPYNSGDTVSLSIDATDDACDSDLGDYTFTCPLPGPDNDECVNATMIACGDTVMGSTANATDTAGNGSNDVFYSLAGTATGEEITVSLCGSGFDTFLSVLDACDGSVVTSNDDSCSLQSEVNFTSDGESTYIILVEGFFSSFSGTGASGDYTLAVTCEGSQDPCANTVAYTWTGASDANWENASNWSNSMAPSLMIMNGEVTIPNGMSNYPMLTMGQDLYIDACSSITVESMASLSVGPNVEVVNDGMVDNSGAVTFESDATGTGYVGAGIGMFMGDYTVERYIPAKRAYRQLSPAVTTNTPIADNWQQDTHITGPAGNTDGFDVTVTGNPSMYIFDNVGYEYVEVANTNATNLYPGTMYHILVRGDRNTDLMDNNAAPSETTLRATGELTSENVGSHMISVNVPEQRFVAVGNPFQSQIDMGTLLSNSSVNINPNFYWVWDPTLGYRGAYTTIMTSSGVATAGSDADQFLQSGQAGWVYTSGAGQASVMFDQSSKDNSGIETSTFSDNSTNNQGLLTLSLFENATLANGGSPVDGILIMSSSNGNNAIDANDAMDITNLDENFAANNNGSLLSIESRAIPVDAEVIQLEINTYRSTNYTIVAEGSSLLGATPFLYDSYTGTYTEIPMNGSVNYTFSVDSNSLSSISGDRFTIVYQQETLSVGGFDLTEVILYPNPTNIGKFHLNVPLGMDDLEITIYDVLGTKLYQESGFAAGNRITVETGDGFSMGTYFVELTSKGKTTTKKLIIN
ncbi:MAG: T9SS type A sorting domain-containing protein, partial [Winogradskyella sp.]|uniref:T9SS type A sorting domain-containing protein n=1 Tax=Winogradskyella sp. TaxID=1883156 RepID=UPI0025D55B05